MPKGSRVAFFSTELFTGTLDEKNANAFGDAQKEVLIDADNFDFEILSVKTINDTVIERDNKKIGYIYVNLFAYNTDIQFRKELLSLEQKGIDSLIVDLRYNTGGHLSSVDAILSILLTDSQITYKLDDGKSVKCYYGSLKKNKDYEIILLGDGYSASASEVLISSLRDNLDAKLIGVKTCGKATVQELITLSNGVQYKITTQKWLSPNGTWVNDTEGIIPDIEVKMDEKYYTTYEKDDDNQLQTAIEYVINKDK